MVFMSIPARQEPSDDQEQDQDHYRQLSLEYGSITSTLSAWSGGQPAKINPPPMVGLQVPQGVQDGGYL